jgi:tripeptide aminopeptidase
MHSRSSSLVAGSARNAVAARAQLEGELRSLDAADLRGPGGALVDRFDTTAREAGARAEVDVRPAYAGHRLPPDSAVVRLAQAAMEMVGGNATTTLTGGGSDANEFNALGIECRVLGIAAERCHSVRERIAVSELVRLAAWVLAILHRAA